jgi:hypothetical protein
MMTTSASRSGPRRFAPLGKTDDEAGNAVPKLKGVVFDVDGTLWLVVTFLVPVVYTLVGGRGWVRMPQIGRRSHITWLTCSQMLLSH